MTQYGLMAENHWRAFRPKMVAELEAKGTLQATLLEAEEQTDAEVDQIRRQLIQQGQTPQQAHDTAWEMVRERYLFLPPESCRPFGIPIPFATKTITASPTRTRSVPARSSKNAATISRPLSC
jgi:hypothetical protein